MPRWSSVLATTPLLLALGLAAHAEQVHGPPVGAARVRFAASAQGFLSELLDKGWEHHLVMAYGDLRPDLGLLAQTLTVPLTML